MRRIIVAPFLVVLASLAVAAQTAGPGAKKATNDPSYGYGYIFAAPGVASGGSATLHIGGGINYWFKKRVGLRFEIRDHVFPQDGAAHLLNGRVGLTFR
jgi:hypothetical protein